VTWDRVRAQLRETIKSETCSPSADATKSDMSIEGNVTVLRYDARGHLQWSSDLSLDDALLAVLRFVRTNPQANCTIELRESSSLGTIKPQNGERD
jgi:hypothetical protein